MMFPEDDFVTLIKGLEQGTCRIPKSSSSDFSPREAIDALSEGVKLKRAGNLEGANSKFIEMFRLQNVICSDALWSWAKVLLLAKDFKHLQLVMHAEQANTYRGRNWFNTFEWMNIHLTMPGLDIQWLYDGSEPNYELYALDYFEQPQQLVERIREYGGNDGYWRFNYSWSPDDYLEFLKYFGPLATDAMDGQVYRWTADELGDLQETYQNSYAAFADYCSSQVSQSEPDIPQYDTNADYINERGLPLFPIPDGDVCDLIAKIQGGCCELPSAGNPPTLETDVAKLFVDAERAILGGDLTRAHSDFLDIFNIQTSIASMVLNSWVRMLLLGKDFGHAQLILNLSSVNMYRGEKWYSFNAQQELNRILIPLPKGLNLLEALSYREDNAIDYTSRAAVEEAIANLSNDNSFWPSHYKLSDEEFEEFQRYFGGDFLSYNYRDEFEFNRRGF